MVEDFLKEYPNVLILRVRMPIVTDLTYHRNFITKIIKYDKVSLSMHIKLKHLHVLFAGPCHSGWFVLQVIDIPNSMTVLPELLPYSIEMVSPVAHCQILEY